MPNRPFLSSVCLSLALFALSCGGSPKNTPPTTTMTAGGGVEFTSPTTAPTILPGQSVTLTVSAPSGDTVTWILQNGNGLGQPSGTLKPSGTSATYTAPAAVSSQVACSATSSPPSPLQMTVTASDGAGDSASLTIVIVQALPCVATTPQVQACVATPNATTCSAYPPTGTSSIACPANGTLMPPGQSGLQPFVVGAYNSIPVYDGGELANQPFGQAPYTWTVSSGSLPAGLALTPGSSTGSVFIAGTPVSAGCTAFTLKITDSLGATGTGKFFVVVVPPSLKLQSPNNATAYGGVSYFTSLTATGGVAPYNWAPAVNATSVNPNSPEDLPPDLTLTFPQQNSTNSAAVISGTVNVNDVGNINNSGAYSLYLQVNDSQSPYPALGGPSLGSIQVLGPNSLCSPAPAITPTAGFGGSATGGNVDVNAFLKGNYAFLLRGFDANGPVAIAGSVQADGTGKITAGEEDVTRSGGSQTVTVVPAGSSYTLGAERNRGCMTLQDSSGSTSIFAFTVGSCSNNYTLSNNTIGPDQSACGIMASNGANAPAGLYTTGRMIEFDSSGTHLSGMLRMQDSSSLSSGLSGLYAFGLSGWNSAGKHYAAAGSAQASSTSLSSAAADINDGGTVASGLTGGSGTIGSADSNGRSSATLTVGSASFSLALYVVSKSEVIVATSDLLSASHPIASGEAIATVGPFSAMSLQNTHMFHIGGVSGTSPDVSIGVVTFDGISAFNGTDFENQAGTIGKTAPSGLYAVDSSSGRTTFSASGTSQSFDHPFVAYIIPPSATLSRTNCAVPANCVTGFLVGTDNTAEDGVLEFQTSLTIPPPPFNNQYLLGDFTFGVDETLDGLTAYDEGFATAAASSSSLTSGTLNGIQDYSYSDTNYCLQSNCTPLVPEGAFAGTYTINSDGTGSFGGFNGETVSVTNGRITFYLNESPLNLHPSVMVGEQ